MSQFDPPIKPTTADSGEVVQAPSPKPDPRGSQLLSDRIGMIEPLLDAYLAQPLPVLNFKADHLVATGLGSSLGHARYLSHLVNSFTDFSCSVASPVDFATPLGGRPVAGMPVLFSQGLSENTHAVVAKMVAGQMGMLFTAFDSADMSQSEGKQRVFQDAREAGISVVPFPSPSEYQILVRVIGPLFGYIAAHRVVSEMPGSRLAPATAEELKAACTVDPMIGHLLAEKFPHTTKEQIKIVIFPPVHQYAHNLAEKLKEGIFLPRPELVDVLEFDHGAFQNACRWGSKILVLSQQNPEPGIQSAAERITISAERAGLEAPFMLAAPEAVRPELRVLWYEMAFNHWINYAIAHSDIDQVNWPGKNLDPNYHVSGK